jgi:hypothetical protein
MKIKDLKRGHVVKMSSELFGTVVATESCNIIICSNNEWVDLNDYNDNMNHKVSPRFNIMKVFEAGNPPHNIIYDRYPKEVSLNEVLILSTILDSGEGYKYIARDKDGLLRIYKTPPVKIEPKGVWELKRSPDGNTFKWFVNMLDRTHGLGFLSHIFSFIKWEDESAYSIEDLVKQYLNI